MTGPPGEVGAPAAASAVISGLDRRSGEMLYGGTPGSLLGLAAKLGMLRVAPEMQQNTPPGFWVKRAGYRGRACALGHSSQFGAPSSGDLAAGRLVSAGLASGLPGADLGAAPPSAGFCDARRFQFNPLVTARNQSLEPAVCSDPTAAAEKKHAHGGGGRRCGHGGQRALPGGTDRCSPWRQTAGTG